MNPPRSQPNMFLLLLIRDELARTNYFYGPQPVTAQQLVKIAQLIWSCEQHIRAVVAGDAPLSCYANPEFRNCYKDCDIMLTGMLTIDSASVDQEGYCALTPSQLCDFFSLPFDCGAKPSIGLGYVPAAITEWLRAVV